MSDLPFILQISDWEKDTSEARDRLQVTTDTQEWVSSVPLGSIIFNLCDD